MDLKLVEKIVLAEKKMEGTNAYIRRSIGLPELDHLDPFLMLDEFFVTPPAGFPDHPHRGFEIVSYIIHGEGMHEDCCGHKGTLKSGDVQWLTTGRGIVHCEMPSGQEETCGLQLWINLPSEEKMIPPECQELTSSEMPCFEKDGVKLKVIAGSSHGLTSSIKTRTPTIYLDVQLEQDASFQQDIPVGWNSFAFVIKGNCLFGPEDEQEEATMYNTVVFEQEGNCVMAKNKTSEPCHFILVGGKPLNQSIAMQGPYVMTTVEEIQQALTDYELKQNGFECAAGWHSELLKLR